MVFSFGMYKGKEISEVAKETPSYLKWVIGNCVNLNDEEFLEIKRQLQFALKHNTELNEQSRIFTAAYDEICEKYIGSYIRNYREYWYIKSFKSDLNRNFLTIQLYGLRCFNAESHNNRIALLDEQICMNHLWFRDIENYEICTKEDFNQNLTKAYEKIRLFAKLE
jgi:hypothetical protein